MMHNPETPQPDEPRPLRLLPAAAIGEREREREEQLARVARQLVGDPSLGITHVSIHGPHYDETFSAREDDDAPDAAPAPRVERGWLRALRARLRRSTR